jgi:nucleotide-binding universal stress UspA family protein
VYTRIVVALDGSPLAERSLPYVEALAEKFGSTVTLLRATASPAALLAAQAPLATSPGAAVMLDPTPTVEAQHDDALAYLRAVEKRLAGRGVATDRALPEGDPADAVVRHALECEVDLIAMTTHGRGGLGRALMGSVADAVVRRAPCPVLLVRVNEES